MRLLIVTQVVDDKDPVLGFFVRWIQEFSKHFQSIEVICLKAGKHELPANVHVYSLEKEKGESNRVVYAWRFLRLAWGLRHDYDAVFVHMNPEYLVLAGWLWKLLGKRSVLWYTHKNVDLKLRIAVFWANTICTASKESFRLQTSKLKVMGHGIDIVQLGSVPRIPRQGTLRILTVGRLSKTKRILEMLGVLDVLHAQGVAFEFSIAGAPATREDGAYEKEVRGALSERPYQEQVHLLGPLSHDKVPKLLARADVFLNLSHTGSMDKAVIEALSAGVPVVTTNEAFAGLLSGQGFVSEIEDAPRVIRAATERSYADLYAQVRTAYALEPLVGRIARLYS